MKGSKTNKKNKIKNKQTKKTLIHFCNAMVQKCYRVERNKRFCLVCELIFGGQACHCKIGRRGSHFFATVLPSFSILKSDVSTIRNRSILEYIL